MRTTVRVLLSSITPVVWQEGHSLSPPDSRVLQNSHRRKTALPPVGYGMRLAFCRKGCQYMKCSAVSSRARANAGQAWAPKSPCPTAPDCRETP